MRRNEHVILFHNASIDPQQLGEGQAADPYESAITARGLVAHTFPVLGQEFVNVPQLETVLQHPEDWTAVVATSKRAGEAWVHAIQRRQASRVRIGTSSLPWLFFALSTLCAEIPASLDWSRTPLYTPGAATTNAFTTAEVSRHWFPTIVAGSEETGCAENLGPFIVADARHRQRRLEGPETSEERPSSSSSKSPFLVLTGDKNSSELTDHLQRNRMEYQELEVYRTCPRPDVHSRLADLLEGIAAASKSTSAGEQTILTVWFACFSPSSTEAVLQATPSLPSSQTTTDTASHHSWIQDLARDLGNRYNVDIRLRMAAIGKTTKNYLVQLGFEGVVQAEKPNAECLARAIAEK
jgi:uroporphyrinogen-III synthase